MNELMKDGKSLRLHCRHFSNTKQARGSKESREGDVIKHRVRHVRPLQSAPKVAPSTIERSLCVLMFSSAFISILKMCVFPDFSNFGFQFFSSQKRKIEEKEGHRDQIDVSAGIGT